MSTTELPSQQNLAPEQVYEIQTMAEGGQFADALIRLRKIKALYPQTTFFVALEKQLERLLVLPRDTEPTESQKKELLDSLPGLIQGAIQAMRSGPPARPMPPPAPTRPAPERMDREVARTQLKDQYFQHADEYLKKGAYGSALVEIRRVKIIAPDDKTALEYERTIRQLVELQQRAGIAALNEAQPAPPAATHHDDEREIALQPQDTEWVAAPSIPAPPAHAHVPAPPAMESMAAAEGGAAHRGGKKWWLFGVMLVCLLGGTGLVTILSAADDSSAEQNPAQIQNAGVTPVSNALHPKQASTTAESTEDPRQDVVTAALNEAVHQTPDRQTGTLQAESSTLATVGDEHRRPVAEPATMPSPQSAPAAQKRVPTPSMQDEPAPIVETVNADSDPRILDLVQPAFTPEMQTLPGGEVIIMVQIDTNGKPVKTMVAKSTNPAFNQPIVTAVLRSTFAPGTTASAPAVKWLTIPFRVN